MMTLLTSALLVFIVGTMVVAVLDFVAAVHAQHQPGAADQRVPAATAVVFATNAAPRQRHARRR